VEEGWSETNEMEFIARTKYKTTTSGLAGLCACGMMTKTLQKIKYWIGYVMVLVV